MKIGVVYPQTEFGNDPGAIREYAQTAEELGYTHILAYEHVLGANPERPGGWKGTYHYEHPFQEPFVLFSYMAAVTESIEFVTGILIMPQRKTALVAKQAATLDILSSGRLRLGVGIGWNAIEYVALNEDFHTRGKRIEEQVELLRLLWEKPLVTYHGRWHSIPDAGLNPLPVQNRIPIWFGGNADAVLKRVAIMGDGWMPNYRTAAETRSSIGKLRRFSEEANRPWSEVGIEARQMFGDGNPAIWEQALNDWRDIGATHLSINTMNSGFRNAAEHLDAIRRFAEWAGI